MSRPMTAPMTNSTRLFGTDGIRGPSGQYPLDRATVTNLGRELALELGRDMPRPTVVLGGDTRFSTTEICSWLAAGLASENADVHFLGVVPTPAVAYATRTREAQAGIAVSASHNPWQDNGIKLIAGDGFKWQDEDEAELEAKLLARNEPELDSEPPLELEPEAAWVEDYVDWLAGMLDGEAPLQGLRIGLDTANGAAAPLAQGLFTRLGAEPVIFNAAPNGRNINLACGSTHPEALQRAVVEQGLSLGVAFDGDADRALFVDERGALRDGDTTLFLWARALRRQGLLNPPKIVATSMSNLGLERALAGEDIEVVRCGVGDRQVVEALREGGLSLGGEQSGHIVHLGLSTTGDGLLTALQVAALVHASGSTLAELLEPFRRFPQVLKNLRVSSKPPLEGLPRVREAAAKVTRELGTDGRLVLRYSGTEPLARVMIEGPDQQTIDSLADEVLAAIADELGEPPS